MNRRGFFGRLLGAAVAGVAAKNAPVAAFEQSEQTVYAASQAQAGTLMYLYAGPLATRTVGWVASDAFADEEDD